MIIPTARDEFDFTLQSGISHGTGTIHTIFVEFLFERGFNFILDLGLTRVGPKFTMTVTNQQKEKEKERENEENVVS